MFPEPRAHVRPTWTRREFVRDALCGFGGLAFSELASRAAAASAPANPLAPKAPHLSAKARSVIFLFMAGGPSHLETFDPKPLLNTLHGQPRPKAFGEAKYQFIKGSAKLLGTRREFRRHGQCGMEVSDLFPHVAHWTDRLALLRSCHGDMVVHSAAQYELFSGRIVPGYPSMGSWLAYGLGSESDSLPAYVVMPDPKGALEAGQPMYGHGFLPAVYQPTMFRPGAKPVLNLSLPEGVTAAQRKRTLDFIRQANLRRMTPEDEDFHARLNAYDLAFKMQTESPSLFDFGCESQETLDLYGVGREPTHDYGRRCLLARKLVEKGVRFVCVVAGGGPGNMQWDAHQDIEENHLRKAAETDRPVAALLADLERRGLLESTLVVWGGEFGRSPEAESGKGRDHHNLGFSMWMAGGGIRGGEIVGATDEIGLHAVRDRVHFRDIHATILHQLGVDSDRLTYPHLGRDERLTFVEGRVIRQIV
ncbi:MAG: DUF1501 domain-containing protein [Verrucomicrobia bacterium]|nr:DUF1501 domain-containing protein [Verrucomicrobiota bacterium]